VMVISPENLVVMMKDGEDGWVGMWMVGVGGKEGLNSSAFLESGEGTSPFLAVSQTVSLKPDQTWFCILLVSATVESGVPFSSFTQR